MAKISDESLKAALVLWKADDKDDVLNYAETRMGDMLTELQTLRELALEAKRANNERPAYADDVLNEKIREWEAL